jgi:hypothetical protein
VTVCFLIAELYSRIIFSNTSIFSSAVATQELIAKASNVNGRHKKSYTISDPKPRRENKRENKSEMNLEEIGQQEVIWINVAHGWVQWRFL